MQTGSYHQKEAMFTKRRKQDRNTKTDQQRTMKENPKSPFGQ
jgi:hypothetical protein